MKHNAPISVLVVDDSAANRRTITQILSEAQGIVVLDRAADGQEGLKKAQELKPDVITLDLEMPKLDGFAFLRLLMTRCPTPVVVISSWAHRSDVFKALELGAYDFVAKPEKARGLDAVKAELIDKVRAARMVKREDVQVDLPPVVLIGASTGGPPAVTKVVQALEGTQASLLVSQHMPPRFTQAFAERLDKLGALKVREASDGDRVLPGQVLIAPGGGQLEVVQGSGNTLLARVREKRDDDRFAPSADLLFESGAKLLGAKTIAVVLTGMGNDGARGAKAVKAAGGEVWAESEQSAVVFGMPQAAIAAGAVSQVLPLPELCSELSRRLRKA